MVGRVLQGAMVAALVLALCGSGAAMAARPGQPHGQTAKKKRHCRAGYKRKKVRRHGKVHYRCVKKKKAKSKPKAPVTTPQVQPGPSALDARLTSHAGFWFEHDLDHDGVCYLYSYAIGSRGEHRGVRTSFYVNPFTGACRVTSEPYAQNSYFVWSTSGNVVTDQFVSGYTERLPTGAYNPADGTMSVGRNGVGVVWADCTSPYWPYVKPAGC